MAQPGRIDAFGGMAPRVAPSQLQESQAQLAYNARLTSGDLEPLNAPLLLASLSGLTGPARAVFKSVTDTAFRWLAWPQRVDAVRALVAGDRTGRVYYTGDGVPQWTTYDLAGRDGYPMASYTLGLPAPTAAPTAVHAGSTGDVANRAFLYSFASADGAQESQASPAAVVAGRVAGTWSISALQHPPGNNYATASASWAAGVLTVATPSTFGLRVGDVLDHGVLGRVTVTGVTALSFSVERAADPTPVTGGFARAVPYDVVGAKWRIYWSEADGSYKLMAEHPVTTALPISIDAAAVGTAVEPLLDAPMPPADLHSLCRHSSGALFGISGNELLASEPYKPYAWPNAYRTPLASDPVACKASGNTVVVGTAGTPQLFIGADPSTMQPEDIKSVWPCLSPRAMVAFPNGVAYPTTFGLAWIGASAPQIVTEASYTERKWRDVYPRTMVAASYGNAYVAAYTTGNSTDFWFFRPGEIAPVSLGAASGVTALYTDPEDGSLIMACGDQIFRFDADDGRRLVCTWMSKEFEAAAPSNIGAFKIRADFTTTVEESAAASEAQERTRESNRAMSFGRRSLGAIGTGFLARFALGGSALAPVPPGTFDQLGVTAFVDDTVVFSARVEDGAVRRLSSAYKSDNITWVITGNVRVSGFEFAGTAQGLRDL
jgi:hypothetical protein